MIWLATLKPHGVGQTSAGSFHQIRVQADSKEEAVKEVRFKAAFEDCSTYAITKIEEIEQ